MRAKWTAVPTLLADYANRSRRSLLRSGLQLVKGFHFAQTVAAGMGIDYATKFLTMLDDDDRKDLFDVYGALPPAEMVHRGMDPRSLWMTKEPA